MFKNRAAQVTFVKTPKVNAEPVDSPKAPRLNAAEIKMLTDTAKGVGVFVVLSAVTFKFADAICEIAVNYAPKK